MSLWLRRLYDARIGIHPVIRWWDGLDRRLGASPDRFERKDLLLCLVFAVLGATVSLAGFHLTETVPGLHRYLDIFLQADVARVTGNMVTTGGSHARTSVHPLASLLLAPFGIGLTSLGLSPQAATKLIVVTVTAAYSGLFCAVLRTLGIGRVGAVVFSSLFLSSAAVIFWSSVVELYTFGAFSIVLALYMMCRVTPIRKLWWGGMTILTLGFTVANWVFGLIATATRFRLKPFLAIILAGFVTTAGLAVLQDRLFAKAALFFNPAIAVGELQFTQPVMTQGKTYEHGWQPLNNIRHIYVTTVVTPRVALDFQNGFAVVTSNQFTQFPKGDMIGVVATVAWVVVLGLGIWGAVIHRAARPAMTGLAAMLGFQTLLHSVYGEITFLYSLHFAPLVVLAAALSWFSPYRWVGIGAAVMVIGFGGYNNVQRFHDTVDLVRCVSDLETVKAYQAVSAFKDATPELPDLDRDRVLKVAADACGVHVP